MGSGSRRAGLDRYCRFYAGAKLRQFCHKVLVLAGAVALVVGKQHAAAPGETRVWALGFKVRVQG